MATLALKYRNLSTLLQRKYFSACEFVGVRDSTETRVFFAVCTGVALFYTCYILERTVRLISEASATLLAIVHQ